MPAETAPAPAANAPATAAAPAAAEPAGTATPAAPAATAPAVVAVEASAPKPGFLARLLSGSSSDDSVTVALRADLASERAEHKTTKDALIAAQAQVAGYQDMETRLEGLLTSEQRAVVAAAAPAAKPAATVDAAVSNGVRDIVAGLGIEPGKLPAAQETIPGAKGDAGEFAHLKGRDRAAAAFSAQMAGLTHA